MTSETARHLIAQRWVKVVGGLVVTLIVGVGVGRASAIEPRFTDIDRRLATHGLKFIELEGKIDRMERILYENTKDVPQMAKDIAVLIDRSDRQERKP